MIDCKPESTTKATYKRPELGGRPKLYTQVPEDELLINGYFRNNLQANGKRISTKTYPRADVTVEEYERYVQRLACCKKELHKLYFRCPSVDVELIERMLRDLEKSTYQLSYSPNVYVRKKFCPPPSPDALKMKEYLTTYGTYYNRLAEFITFKDILKTVVKKEDKHHGETRNQLRKLYRTGQSTYYGTICIPALRWEQQHKHPDAEVPLDRYTLRKI